QWEAVLVAVVQDWNAAHPLHDEIRPPLGRAAAVEDLRDVGMIEEGQRLALGLEARDHFARVHAELDELEGDTTADGPLLLCFVDLAHAAGAELLDQDVVADPPQARAGGALWERRSGIVHGGVRHAATSTRK